MEINQHISNKVLYFLYILYIKDKKNLNLESLHFYSLKNVMKFVYPEHEIEYVTGMANLLVAKGFIKANYRLGDIDVLLLNKGIDFVERKKNTKNYLEFEKSLNNISLDEFKSIYEDTLKKQMIDYINNFENKINSFLRKDNDLKIDLDILKMEFKKEKPDKEVIFLIIFNISKKTANKEVDKFKYLLNLA
jgi:hypothetical protein